MLEPYAEDQIATSSAPKTSLPKITRLEQKTTQQVSGFLQGVLSSLVAPDSSGRSRDFSRLRPSSSSAQLSGLAGSKDGGFVAAQLAAWRNRRGFALDITAFDGAELLSSKVSTKDDISLDFSISFKSDQNY